MIDGLIARRLIQVWTGQQGMVRPGLDRVAVQVMSVCRAGRADSFKGQGGHGQGRPG